MTNPSQSATDSRPADEDEQYQEPPDDAYPIPDRQIPVSEALIRSVIDSLERVEDFIRRYANPSVHQDLRHYAQTQGWHPATGPEAFLDSIALGAHSLAHVLTAERRPPQA
ncbi:MAG TPA: hypothetical protein VFC00_08555 [Micromonosporaceae bacterium]|nr:hypothetical protein [Micromonosporaceae bacterium]